MKFSEAREMLTKIVEHNINCAERTNSVNDFIVPFLMGDPGVGKTDIPKSVARDLEIPYEQAIVAQYDAGEMAGLPFIDKREMPMLSADGKPVIDADKNIVYRTETQMIRLRPSYLPSVPVGIFNLDELPQAFLANQNICSQIVNEWRVGDHKISRGVTICATGNKPSNKAGTTTIPTHLRDRLTYILIEADPKEWLNYASQVGADFRVRAYIAQNEGKLHKFDPTADANPTPRSWMKVSAMLGLGLPQHIRTEMLHGQIGPLATEFESWLRVEDRLPKIEDIIANPKDENKAPVFGNKDADISYLILTALADKSDAKNIGAILEYIKRQPNQEFALYWAQAAFSRDKSLLGRKEVTEWKLKHGSKLVL